MFSINSSSCPKVNRPLNKVKINPLLNITRKYNSISIIPFLTSPVIPIYYWKPGSQCPILFFNGQLNMLDIRKNRENPFRRCDYCWYREEPIYLIMKKHKKKSIKIFVLAILSFGFSMKLYAQNQPDIPKPRGPVDLSDPTNVVIFIVIPILIFIFYLIWRREMKKRKEREE
jgi:uncharacterized membrane protein